MRRSSLRDFQHHLIEKRAIQPPSDLAWKEEKFIAS
jgi:hypothetical protein